MKAMKVEILILDFDGCGESEIKNIIENTKYPNRCIHPEVKSIKTVDINWSDDHPLNIKSTSDEAYIDLFD
jgi:hypothetical protein